MPVKQARSITLWVKRLLAGPAWQMGLQAWHPQHLVACLPEASLLPEVCLLLGLLLPEVYLLPHRLLAPRRPRLRTLRHDTRCTLQLAADISKTVSAHEMCLARMLLLLSLFLMPCLLLMPCRPRMHPPRHGTCCTHQLAAATSLIVRAPVAHHTKVLLIETGLTLSTWEPQHAVFQHSRPCRVSCLYSYAQTAISAVVYFR